MDVAILTIDTVLGTLVYGHVIDPALLLPIGAFCDLCYIKPEP